MADNPASTRRWPIVGLTLDQRRGRWANVSPTVGQRLVFAGNTIFFLNGDPRLDLLVFNIY